MWNQFFLFVEYLCFQGAVMYLNNTALANRCDFRFAALPTDASQSASCPRVKDACYANAAHAAGATDNSGMSVTPAIDTLIIANIINLCMAVFIDSWISTSRPDS